MKKVIVMMGLPGSGKSYRANSILNYERSLGRSGVINSTDDFWHWRCVRKTTGETRIFRGEYGFNPTRLKEAHRANYELFLKNIKKGVDVIIVDNVNANEDAWQYIDAARFYEYEVFVAESTAWWAWDPHRCFENGTHNVPKYILERLTESFSDQGLPEYTDDLWVRQDHFQLELDFDGSNEDDPDPDGSSRKEVEDMIEHILTYAEKIGDVSVEEETENKYPRISVPIVDESGENLGVKELPMNNFFAQNKGVADEFMFVAIPGFDIFPEVGKYENLKDLIECHRNMVFGQTKNYILEVCRNLHVLFWPWKNFSYHLEDDKSKKLILVNRKYRFDWDQCKTLGLHPAKVATYMWQSCKSEEVNLKFKVISSEELYADGHAFAYKTRDLDPILRDSKSDLFKLIGQKWEVDEDTVTPISPHAFKGMVGFYKESDDFLKGSSLSRERREELYSLMKEGFVLCTDDTIKGIKVPKGEIMDVKMTLFVHDDSLSTINTTGRKVTINYDLWNFINVVDENGNIRHSRKLSKKFLRNARALKNALNGGPKKIAEYLKATTSFEDSENGEFSMKVENLANLLSAGMKLGFGKHRKLYDALVEDLLKIVFNKIRNVKVPGVGAKAVPAYIGDYEIVMPIWAKSRYKVGDLVKVFRHPAANAFTMKVIDFKGFGIGLNESMIKLLNGDYDGDIVYAVGADQILSEGESMVLNTIDLDSLNNVDESKIMGGLYDKACMPTLTSVMQNAEPPIQLIGQWVDMEFAGVGLANYNVTTFNEYKLFRSDIERMVAFNYVEEASIALKKAGTKKYANMVYLMYLMHGNNIFRKISTSLAKCKWVDNKPWDIPDKIRDILGWDKKSHHSWREVFDNINIIVHKSPSGNELINYTLRNLQGIMIKGATDSHRAVARAFIYNERKLKPLFYAVGIESGMITDVDGNEVITCGMVGESRGGLLHQISGRIAKYYRLDKDTRKFYREQFRQAIEEGLAAIRSNIAKAAKEMGISSGGRRYVADNFCDIIIAISLIATDSYLLAHQMSWGSIAAAVELIEGGGGDELPNPPTHAPSVPEKVQLRITTDGSYSTNNDGVYGWGAIIEAGDETLAKLNGAAKGVFADSRNIGGECYAVIAALRWAYAHGYRDVIIRHDFTGLAYWARGLWKAKTPVARAFVDKIKKAIEAGMSIAFQKIPAGQNPADALARIATGASSAH